ncbi:shikimate kinase [Candidatus Odyssella thessalonicensis]|uniref:shikimate kinase n=1 Tax=Candidatus Odyssella thessalonicensis TaxID=84647 RepID=UPI000225C11A|nr:shikimate kinase [Candidatus Odyssella thessalonicensis]
MKQEAHAFNLVNPSQLSFRAPKTIVLVGLMGAGKTSIGRRLAKRLDVEFFDSDHEVEVAAGCPIKEIFNIYGEDAFRVGEYRVINRLLDQQTHVLATGGGSFMEEKTREVIKQKAISVWLKADLETLVARVSRRTDRPLLEDAEAHHDVLSQLIAERYPVYEGADVIVDTYDEPTNTTVDRVIVSLAEYIRDRFPKDYVLKSI